MLLLFFEGGGTAAVPATSTFSRFLTDFAA